MSDVFIVETVSVYDNDSQLSVHEDRNDAIHYAASKMYWWFDQFGFNDPMNVEDHQIYTEVDNYIKAGEIDMAMDVFNDIDNIKGRDDEYIRVSLCRYTVKRAQDKVASSCDMGNPTVESKEFACPTCQRNNYAGETTCWNCGNPI